MATNEEYTNYKKNMNLAMALTRMSMPVAADAITQCVAEINGCDSAFSKLVNKARVKFAQNSRDGEVIGFSAQFSKGISSHIIDIVIAPDSEYALTVICRGYKRFNPTKSTRITVYPFAFDKNPENAHQFLTLIHSSKKGKIVHDFFAAKDGDTIFVAKKSTYNGLIGPDESALFSKSELIDVLHGDTELDLM